MNSEDKEEIDLLELGKKLWDKKKFIIKCTIVGAFVGIIVAFSIPKEYTTTVILAAESKSSVGGNMGALASMAGLNLGATSDDIFSPELYPNIIESTPFIRGLLNINVIDKKQDINVSLYNYLKDYQKQAWWSYILKAPGAFIQLFSSESKENTTIADPRYISKEEMDLIKSLQTSCFISTDKKTGVTSIEVVAQSPVISAFLADTLTSYLQSYVIDQRTKKAKTDLANSEKLYQQAKSDYYKTQQILATFIDANKNVISAKYKISQEKLQNEASIAYSVYNQMAQQVQISKIKIQDNTPVFTVIQPAIEPLLASKPKKKMIIAAFFLLGMIGACGWILGKDYISKL